MSKEELNKIANEYHLNTKISDKQFDKRFHILCGTWVSGMISSSSRVLEMGFGEGNVTEQLLAVGAEVEIVEGSELLVEQARSIYGSKVRVHHDLFDDFRPTSDFDIILATNILEHVDDPISALSNILKWCSEETRVVVTVPNAESIHRKLAVIMGLQPKLDSLSPRDHLVGHQRVYNFDQLSQQVLEAGFEIKEQKGFLLKVLPNSMMKDMSPELINAFYEIANELPIQQAADMAVVLKRLL